MFLWRQFIRRVFFSNWPRDTFRRAISRRPAEAFGVGILSDWLTGREEERAANVMCVSDDGRRVDCGSSDSRTISALHANLFLSERPARRQSAARLAHLHRVRWVAVGRASPAAAVHVHAVRLPDDPHHRAVRPYRAGRTALRPVAGSSRVQQRHWHDIVPQTQFGHSVVTDWTQLRVESVAVAQKRHRNARSVIPASEMTYIVLSGALNSTHSLGQWFRACD